MEVFFTFSQEESHRTHPFLTVTFLIVVKAVIDFSVFVSGIACQHFFFLFGHKTFQEADCFFTKWDDSKAPSLVAHFQLEGRGSTTPKVGKSGAKMAVKAFWVWKGGWKADTACEFHSQTVRTGLMSSHPSEHAAGSLELISAVLWGYHAVSGESKPFTTAWTCRSFPVLPNTPKTRTACYKLVIWTWKRT